MENTLTWLHLSDWHQQKTDFDRSEVLKVLLKDIREKKESISDLARIDFIAFTGDVAYHGWKDEYDEASTSFFTPLMEAAGVKKDRLFIVPGNHDVDQDVVAVERLEQLGTRESVNKWQSEAKFRHSLLSPMTQYTQFVKRYLGDVQKFEEDAFWFRRHLPAGEAKVAIVGLNSAWLSGCHKEDGLVSDRGKLLVGERQVADSLESAADADLVIALMHHPLDWLQETDWHLIESRLRGRCHFLLRGHTHRPDFKNTLGPRGGIFEIPSGACYERRYHKDEWYANAYNLVHLNLETGHGIVHVQKYGANSNRWIPDEESAPDGKYEFQIPVRITRTAPRRVSIKAARATPTASPASQWLAHFGISGNPFTAFQTKDDPKISDYFVFSVIDLSSLLDQQECSAVFAPSGAGKTAIRQMIENECLPYRDDSQRLAVVFDATDFENVLSRVDGKSPKLQPEHFIALFIRKGMKSLQELVEKSPVVRATLSEPEWSRWRHEFTAIYLPEIAGKDAAKGTADLSEMVPLDRLSQFMAILNAAGVISCVLLVDGVDEVRVVSDEKLEAKRLLKYLVNYPPLTRRPDIAIKLFLPDWLKDESKNSWYRTDLMHPYQIEWNAARLNEVIDNRLKPKRLAELCEDELSTKIYAEIAQQTNNPREAIRFVDALFETQSRKSPLSRIGVETYKQVKAKWQIEHSAAAPETSASGNWLIDEVNRRIVVDGQEIAHLGKQAFDTLIFLYKHAGQFCSKNLLVETIWDVRNGVADSPIYSTINRIRTALPATKKYIENKSKLGYRLIPEGIPLKPDKRVIKSRTKRAKQ